MAKKKSKTARLLVADAGEDQIVYARYGGVANVNLNSSKGSRSKRFTYTWYLDGSPIAMGVRPTVKLISGEHTITLVVDDGRGHSEPSKVVITVVDPMEVKCRIFPPRGKMLKKKPEIMTTLYMPPGITKEEIDLDRPLHLYPGDKEVEHHYVMQWRKRGTPIASVFAFFDRDLVMDAAPEKGSVELAVAGQFKTGRCFYGDDTLNVADLNVTAISKKETVLV